jgi:hypothetical protein
MGERYMTATLADLFRKEEARCDACGEPLVEKDESFALLGRGQYLWSRGDQVRFEDAPLCPACAAAIGLSALARWEIEEEEG